MSSVLVHICLSGQADMIKQHTYLETQMLLGVHSWQVELCLSAQLPECSSSTVPSPCDCGADHELWFTAQCQSSYGVGLACAPLQRLVP